MSHEHSRIRHLKQRWDDEDAVRDELERRAKQMFLEEQANQIFAPIEDYLTRLDKVLRACRNPCRSRIFSSPQLKREKSLQRRCAQLLENSGGHAGGF
jgi:hypothetical protein